MVTYLNPSDIESDFQRMETEPSVNLETFQVTGSGNEHEFALHARDIDRKDMPQLPEKKRDMKEFIRSLKDAGIHVTFRQVDPRTLEATQDELDSVKVAKLFARIEQGGWKADTVIIVSREYDILDGHHRWAAACAYAMTTNQEFRVTVLWIDLPIDDLLLFAERFSGPHKSFDTQTVIQ